MTEDMARRHRLASATGAIDMGTFYSTNYISIVVPETRPRATGDDILDKIVKMRADGNYEVFDVKAKRTLQFGNNIKTDVKIDTDHNLLSIKTEDTNGNRYETVTQLDDYLAEIGDKSLSPERLAFDSFGAAFNYSRFRFEGMKTNQKSKLVHDSYQYLKRNWRYRPKTKPSVMYRDRIPKSYRYGGRVLFAVSASLIAGNIIENKAIRGSNVLDIGVLLISAYVPYGWVGGIAYFAVDAGLYIYTDKSIGDYLNQYLHDDMNISDGVLFNFD